MMSGGGGMESVTRLTGLSSGRLVKGSPVMSSNPGTLGLLYDALYTLPDGRWTYLSEMRARITSSGTSRLTIRVSGMDLVLCPGQMYTQREKFSGTHLRCSFNIFPCPRVLGNPSRIHG